MSDANTGQMPNDALNAGFQALARGAWDEARERFESALREGETPEALEGLGLAAWWRDNAALTFDARKRAYQLYRKRGDNQSAARLAVNLAYDYYSFRGEYAISNGWFQRAHRLLEGLDMVPERCILAIYEGTLALGLSNDTNKALTLGEQAVSVGRALGVIDLEMLALAYMGMVYVNAGRVAEGMRFLDESTTAAVSGEIANPDACANTCCFLIYACEQVRDYDRAAQWCAYVEELATRWNYSLMFSLCRARYAGIMIWRGEWAAAEAVLAGTNSALIATRPAEAAEGIVRLADLRRRQGRFEDAAVLLDQAESHPVRPLGANLARLERVALALEQGDARTAAELADRFLRGLPTENQLHRSSALELLAAAQVALGDVDRAAETFAKLQSLAALSATEPLRAAAFFIEGIVAAAQGDYETARRRLEDAVDLYQHNGAPYETAQARLELARVLRALGRIQAAGQQADQARDAFRLLGAQPGTARADALVREIETSQKQAVMLHNAANLTPREIEILSLVAAGKSNQEIAAGLTLSIRTVERHISSIYDKIGASGPAARATATAFFLLHNPT